MRGSPVLWPGFLLHPIMALFTLHTFDYMPLVHLDIHHAEAQSALMRVMHSDYPVAVVQFPAVFALLAPSTPLGVEALNDSKQRLNGKHYGSAIGSLKDFAALADKAYLPSAFHSDIDSMRALEGAFIRLKVTQPDFGSAAVTRGTHQGLLLPEGPHRKLFCMIEQEFQMQSGNPLFDGARYFAPLCTSANISGDTAGSILDFERAMAFAEQRNLQLLITSSNTAAQESGSYPIFAFEQNTVRIMRHGPSQERILHALPSSITLL